MVGEPQPATRTRLPRVVIAAPASGQGKTTVAVGIMACLTRRGHQVAAGKVGPDYIDPGYHVLATGRPGRNLDPWLTGESLIVPLLLHGARTPRPADVAVIEGVMGLFDGQLGGDGFASTAHLAALTASPVIVVVDISSASRTVAATVHGLADFDPAISVAGVILNKAGSDRHAAEVCRAVTALGLPVLGVLPRHAGVSAPSRHLGLVPVAERDDAAATLDRLAEQTERYLDLDAVLDIAGTAADLDGEPWNPSAAVASGAGSGVAARLGSGVGAETGAAAGCEVGTAGHGQGPVVAVAGGRAFTFRYSETEELLRAAGCQPVVIDPALDCTLPPGCSGLYLGGGFPEVHALELSRNTELINELREAIGAGMPTVAECAGLLYLCRAVEGHPFVAAVPATAAMHPGLRIGYRRAVLAADGVLGPAGLQVRGHEFHRTRTDPGWGTTPGWVFEEEGGQRLDGFALDPAGTGTPSLHASYLHLNWAGTPQIASHFADRVADFATRPALAAVRRPATLDGWVESTSTGRDPAPEPSPEPNLDHHGDAELDGRLVDFAVNVRLPGPPSWLAEIITESTASLGRYPDVSAARTALARRHGIPESMVLPTNGGAEAFSLIAAAVPGRNPLIVHPQFTEPEAALRRCGRIAARHLLSADDGFTLRPTEVDGAADLVMVGNPTNPTGVLHPLSAISDLRRPGRVLVVDEAFIDAIEGEPSMIGADLDGVLVVRSLTKTWGLAGLRAGYVVGDPRLIALLADRQPPWSVSAPAAAVMTAVSTPAALAEVRAAAADYAVWRAHLVRGLRSLGLRPVDGQAPFVLVEVPEHTRESLRGKGYAVRRGDTFPGLGPGWIRLAVRDPHRCDGLLRELTGTLGHRQSA